MTDQAPLTIDTNTQNPEASAPQGAPVVLRRRPAPAPTSVIGTIVSAVGLIAWFAWLTWRTTSFNGSIVNVAILALELVAFAASLVVCAGLAVSRPPRRRGRRVTDRGCQLPMLRPELGLYGATGRLEEDSVRHFTLGLTLAVAAVGFVAGVLRATHLTPPPSNFKKFFQKFLKSIKKHADELPGVVAASFIDLPFHYSGGVLRGLGTWPVD